MTPAVSGSSPPPITGSVTLTAPKKITRCALPIIWGLGSILSLALGALKLTAVVTILGTAATPVGWALIGLGVILGGIAVYVCVRNRKNAQLESRINAFCAVSDYKNQIVEAWKAYNRYKTGNQFTLASLQLYQDYTMKCQNVHSKLIKALGKRLSNREFQVIRENWFSQLDQAASASAAPAAPAAEAAKAAAPADPAASASAAAAASRSPKAVEAGSASSSIKVTQSRDRSTNQKKTPYSLDEMMLLIEAFNLFQQAQEKWTAIRKCENDIRTIEIQKKSSKNTKLLKNLKHNIRENFAWLNNHTKLLEYAQTLVTTLPRMNPALFSKLLMSFISNPEHFNQEVHALSTNPTRLAALMEMVDFKDIMIMEVEELQALIDLTLNLLEHLKSYSLISLKDANYFKTLLIPYKDLLNTYDDALTSLDSSQSLESEERSLLIQENLKATVQATCLLIHNHWDDHDLQELHGKTIEAINDLYRPRAG